MIGRSNAVGGGEKNTITIKENGVTGFNTLTINGKNIPQGGSIKVEVGSYVNISISASQYEFVDEDGIYVPTRSGEAPLTKAPPMTNNYYLVAPNKTVYIS